MIDETTLTERQEHVLTALLSEPTIRDAARVSGVSEATIYRWKREEPAFRDALRAARRAALDQARRSLEDLAQTASQTLKEVMEDRKAPATARVAAARSVWQLVDQGHDTDEIDDLIAELRGDLDDQ